MTSKSGQTSSNTASSLKTPRVYVGNLSWSTTWQSLKDHMKQVGDVKFADILMDNVKHRSRGCGLVEFVSIKDAQEAIEKLNDSELDGRKIFVREDREEKGFKPSRPFDNYQNKSGSGEKKFGRQIFVGNLSQKTGMNELSEAFEQCGNISSIKIHDGLKSRFATILFDSKEAAADAIDNYDGVEFQGSELTVYLDKRVF